MDPTASHRLITFQPRDGLDRLFAVSITVKGLDGLLELLAGLVLLLVSPEQIEAAVGVLANSTLGSLLPDAVSTWATSAAERLSVSGLAFGAAYLLAHGIVKIVLVVALLRDKLWAYPWMIVVLVGFVLFQCYEFSHHPAAGLAVLTVFDIAVIVLTGREYRRQRQHRRHSAGDRGEAPGASSTRAAADRDQQRSLQRAG